MGKDGFFMMDCIVMALEFLILVEELMIISCGRKDSAGHILSICQKEENGLNHGKCVFFVNGELNVSSSWVHGKEITTLQEFWGTTLLEYKHGKCVYKGPFE